VPTASLLTCVLTSRDLRVCCRSASVPVICYSPTTDTLLQDAQSKLREAPTVEEVAWLRDREKSFSAALDKMKQEYDRSPTLATVCW
jgi:hypothetical protein